MIFFSIFNLNLTIVIAKASKHLPKATEVMTWRSGIETYHVKILNGLISYRAVRSLNRILCFS